MGSYEWACPKCGQAQKVRAPNGTEVQPRLCAACEEAERKEKESVIENDHSRKGNGKEKARA